MTEQAYKSTPHNELIAQIMSETTAKTEREHAAKREIERLTQRTWQGLTDEEVDECYFWKDQWTTDELVRHVEAKLKEKNT